MLQENVDRLLFELKDASFFQIAPSSEDRDAWADLPGEYRARLIREADAAAQTPVPPLSASGYMRFQRGGEASEYRAAYQTRRDMISALVMGMTLRQESRDDEQLADLLWAVCEESSWVLPENSPLSMGQDSLPLPDIYQPLIDEAAANTALDLCMAAQIAGERLCAVTPQLLQRVTWELKRRIIDPFLTARDFDWMCGPKNGAFACLRGVMISFLSFEQDGRRRWQCMRKAFLLLSRLLDQIPQDGSIAGGVTGWLGTAGPVVDCLSMIDTATGGAMDLRREMQIQLMCHYPVFCHMAEGWFVNPGAQSMRPELSGAAMYRLGMSVRDGALCDLGAFLLRTQGEGPHEPLLMHRCQNALLRARLEREEGRPPFRRQGYLNTEELMVARMAEDEERGLAFAIRGGHNGRIGGHPDVGDVLLFAQGQPVLVDAGFLEETGMHSLPEIGGFGQVSGAVRQAEDVACQLEDDYAMISMNLAGVYPQEARVSSWQRSLIFNRDEGTAQLIEVFDLSAFMTVQFHFLSACKPHVGERVAQLGPARLRWEAGLNASVQDIPVPEGPWRALWGETLYRLTLTTENEVNGGQYTFNLNALRTFG